MLSSRHRLKRDSFFRIDKSLIINIMNHAREGLHSGIKPHFGPLEWVHGCLFLILYEESLMKHDVQR